MGFDLTPSQSNAISADGGILVSAAAGSGKTSVLTERVIRKLTDENSKVSADKLLIVTFTNAAALEMRTRIENALLAKIAETPNNDNLIEQYNLLASSDISTIDSFCINIVRENFEDCGVDQNFTVTDGSDLTDLKEGILSELIDQKFDSKDPVFRELLSILNCEDNDNNLREIVKEIYKKSTTIPFPEKYLSELVEPYSNCFDSNHIWFKDAFDFARSGLEEAREYLDQIYELGATVKANPDKLQEEIDHFKWFYDQLEQCLKNNDWDGVSSLAISYEHPTARILDNSETGVKYKYCREQLSEYFKELKYYFPYPIKEIDETVKAVNSPLSMLFDMVREYSEKIFETFVENNTLTFYHTEQLALKLLCKVADNGDVSRTRIAEDYISRYNEVMVDEYQDVNDLQELMFSILSDDCKKLFAVGDIKQSIYRFRGSNPKNFLKKKNDYNPFDPDNSQNKQKIILSENFRSRKCICDFVNFVFEKLLTTETGGIVYNEEEVLNFAAKYYIEKNDELTDLIALNTDSDSEDKYEVESNAIAGYINELVLSEKMIKDGDGEKPVTFGDICILLESKSKAPTIVKSLKNHGIPVSYNSDDYCKTAEISLVLSLLSVIDNPLNNVDLLTVLLSPIFSFTPDDIVLIRKYERYGDLYRAVLLAAKNGDKKCVNFIEKINELKKKRMIMPFSRFLTYLVYDTEIFAVISSLDNSHYRRKNIYTLISYANSFSGNGIGEFVSHIRSLDNDAFAIVDNDINSVKIMTMHKSKGLQFPVCILANLSKRFNKDDMQGSYILSEKYGFTFKPFDDDRYEYIESVGNELAKRSENDGFIAERIRLLYVAMTRAEEKLVLVTALPGKDTFSKMAASLTSGKIPTKSILRSGSLAQFVLMACLMHPDAGVLRSLSGIDVPVVPTESRLNVTVYEESDLQDVSTLSQENADPIDPELVEQIKKNISYDYPNEILSQIVSKTSVSAVAHSSLDQEYYFTDRPSFMNDSGVSATEKGTAIHKIMQFIELKNDIDVDSEIDRLVEWKFITEKEGEIADRERIKAFFDSNLYARITASNEVKREMRFLTELNAGDIFDVPEDFSDKKVIVQGAVDLLFVEDDGLVIVDFKTDRVEDAEELVDRYAEQLKLYSVACSKKFEKPVKELIIYSFKLSKEIKL